MPVTHRTKFEHKCPKTYQEKLRTPGCAIDNKPFEPHSRTKPLEQKSGVERVNVTPGSFVAPSANTQGLIHRRRGMLPGPQVPVDKYDSAISNMNSPDPSQDSETSAPAPRRGVNPENFADVYKGKIIEEFTPELKTKFQFMDTAYEARQMYDAIMENLYIDRSNSEKDMTPEEFVENPDNIQHALEEAMNHMDTEVGSIKSVNPPVSDISYGNTETGDNVVDERMIDDTFTPRGDTKRYTIDRANTTPDVMVVVDNFTNEAFMVMHGANAGHKETTTGRAINEYDKASFTRAYTLPKDRTAERYPKIDGIADRLLSKYRKVSSVVYSNSGPMGTHLNVTKKIPMTAFDPVVGTAQAGHLRAGLPAEAHFVRTNKFSIGMETGKLTNPLRQLSDPLAASDPARNIKITNISPVADSEGFVTPYADHLETIQERNDQAREVSMNDQVVRIPTMRERGEAAARHSLDVLHNSVLGGHAMTHYKDQGRVRAYSAGDVVRPGIFTTGIRTYNQIGKSTATAALSGWAADLIDPNSTGQAKLAETATINIGADAGLAAGGAKLAGRGALTAGRAAALELALPTFAAYEAATGVGQMIDNATAGWHDQGAAHALSGGAAGGVAGGAAAATGLAQRAAGKAASSAFSRLAARFAGYQAVPAAEVEMTSMAAAGEGAGLLTTEAAAAGEATAVGEGIEMAAFAAEGATAAAEGGALAGGMEAAGALSVVPIPGFRIIGGAVAIGTLVGVGLGWIFSDHDPPEVKQRKALEHKEAIQARFEELKSKYETAYAARQVNLDSLDETLIDPKSVLTQDEMNFLNENSSTKDFFSPYQENVTRVWQSEREARGIMQSLNRRMSMDPFFDTSRLAGGEWQYLHARHPEIIREIQQRSAANMNIVKQQSERLNVPVERLIKLYGDRHRGFTGGRARTPFTDADFNTEMDALEANALHISTEQYTTLVNTDEAETDETYNQMLQDTAHSQGFLNQDDYLQSRDPEKYATVRTQTINQANYYLSNRQEARDHGFRTTDEYQYRNHMQDWTPDQSRILQAHRNGFNLDMYTRFMRNIATDRTIDGSQITDDSTSDEQLFNRDLASAGFDPNDFSSFHARDSTLTRNFQQVQDIYALNTYGGNTNDLISGLPKDGVSAYIHQYTHRHLLDYVRNHSSDINQRRQEAYQLTYGPKTASEFWQQYEGARQQPTSDQVSEQQMDQMADDLQAGGDETEVLN